MSNLSKRLRIWTKDPTCFVCKNEIINFTDVTIEHIVPKSKGGTNAPSNIAISHRDCNHLKGSSVFPHEWEKRLNSGVFRNTPYEISELKTWHFGLGEDDLRKLLCIAFSEREFILKTLDFFPEQSSPKNNQNFEQIKDRLISLVRHLQSLELNELIKISLLAYQGETANYWKVIIGLIFFQHYLETRSELAFQHADELFNSFQDQIKHLKTYQYVNYLIKAFAYAKQ
ncbi:HNH endonuclease [Peredibacter starrii]|uniref:HNH endonuclease signature motif containing protein n=1 Tax=Peredibacter starrii TaxID=28202 RepID=A0AAX4HRL0_9BACT|nr:HNH endonuclease signature motif containing protein [Peredibacter starrii]WPU65810.1 HNH endonuclease signature motif containing protein [Peredibacter starrii]